MATDKRERQRQNREKKQVLERKEAKKSSAFKTIRNIVLIVAGLFGVVFLISLLSGEDELTTGSEVDIVNTEDSEGNEAELQENDAAEESTEDNEAEQVVSSLPCPPSDGSAEQTRTFDGVPPDCLEDGVDYSAVMNTNFGTIEIDLDENFPTTVNSFVYLGGYKYFDGLTFHRVIEDFVIQGGDPSGDGTGGPGYNLVDEFPDSLDAYKVGTVAMAKTAAPNSTGSQFFIVTGDNPLPGPEFNILGEVTNGLDIALEISQTETAGADAPVEEVTIESVEIIQS